MSERSKDTIWIFSLIFIFITIGFCCVLGKIIHTQYFDSEKWLEVAHNQAKRDDIIPANRGNIYDCNGQLLAGSAASYDIYMDCSVPWLQKNKGANFKIYVDSISNAMADYFGEKTAEEYKEMFTTAFYKKTMRLKLTKNRITFTQLQVVKQMPLFKKGRIKSGLLIEPKYTRVKPFGSLAARTIGSIYGSNGKGLAGLEAGYEDVLAGEAGHKMIDMVDGRIVSIEDIDPIDGMDIVTTLDANIQDVVETHLRRTLERLQAEWGCCVLMDVKTGEVKAISNLGLVDDTYRENKNYAVTRIEPGSTFKTYALLAALDDGKVSITDTIDVELGKWIYTDKKHPIKDSHPYRDKNGNYLTRTKFTVKEILSASSNVGLAKIVTESYEKSATKFVDKIQKMGVCEETKCDVPGKTQPIIRVPKDNETLAKMSFGYSVELAPIDILMFYNAIANNGKMIRPYMVSEIQKNGHTEKRFHTDVVKSSICKSSSLRDIRECLESVVWGDYSNSQVMGTASAVGVGKARSKKVHIAGKTGTAQILINGNYEKEQHRTLFCGYFPMEEPKYTCICVIQQRHRAKYDAGRDCGGTVREIAEKVMAYKGDIDIEDMSVNPDSLRLPTIKRGLHQDITTATKRVHIAVAEPVDEAEWIRVNEHYEAESLNVNEQFVPNVVGMGAKDAIYAIEQTGMLATIRGKGKVISQSVAAGTKAQKGAGVILELK